jgi:hypothetical protein
MKELIVPLAAMVSALVTIYLIAQICLAIWRKIKGVYYGRK